MHTNTGYRYGSTGRSRPVKYILTKCFRPSHIRINDRAHCQAEETWYAWQFRSVEDFCSMCSWVQQRNLVDVWRFMASFSRSYGLWRTQTANVSWNLEPLEPTIKSLCSALLLLCRRSVKAGSLIRWSFFWNAGQERAPYSWWIVVYVVLWKRHDGSSRVSVNASVEWFGN